MGELVDEKTIIRNIIKTLPGRFNPKVSILEYSENLDKLSKEELHGVLIAYEMRLAEEEGTSHLETVFITSNKTSKEKKIQRKRLAPASVKKREMMEKVFQMKYMLIL